MPRRDYTHEDFYQKNVGHTGVVGGGRSVEHGATKEGDDMTGEKWGITAVFVLYLLGMLGIGGVFFRRGEGLADYFLGDRKLNRWVTSLSAQASDMSGWLLLGLPGAAYAAGLSASWIAIGLLIGTYLNWRLIAQRLRLYTGVSDEIITITDYLEYRFRDDSHVLRLVAAIFIVVFFLLYTSSGFVAGAKLFSTVFGFPYVGALLVGVVVVVSYTFLGGFNAVCWTDLFQGSLMLFAILVVPIVAVGFEGGLRSVADQLMAVDANALSMFPAGESSTGFVLAVGVASSMAWGLGYFGQPHILVRFMAIRSPGLIAGARRIALVWVTLALAGALAVGMVGRVYVSPALTGPDTERVFIEMVGGMFPSLIAGVLLAAILAAIMSTADSQLLVTASAITEDVYRLFLRRNASQKELVWVSRLAVAVVAVIAFLLALDPASSVLELVAYAWAGFGAAFGPVIVLSLFWKRMTRVGALSGIVVGGVTVLVWRHLKGGVFELYEIAPGFAFAVCAILIASLLSPDPGQEITNEFESVLGSKVRETA